MGCSVLFLVIYLLQFELFGFTKGNNNLIITNLFVDGSDEIYVKEIYNKDFGLEIVYDLILAFQTLVMTDNEEEELARGIETDVNKLFLRKTLEYGFNVNNNGLISLNN